MKRAAIYLRVSSVGQVQRAESAEGFSIEAQRTACLRRAAEIEADVAGEYVDYAESAKTTDRPKLQALLARLKTERDLDLVIVHKLDRLARNRADDVAIVAAIRGAGAHLVSVSENIDETPTGSLLHGIMASVAEFYSNNLAQEAKKGLHQKAKNGGTPGLAPIGYLNVRQIIEGREVRTIEIDEERAPHIRWAFAAYASGAYTLDTLHAALAARGLTTRPTAKRPARPLSRSRLAVLLANPYVIGIVRYGGVEYPGRHEALIDTQTFSRVQSVLAAHSQAGEKDRKHQHYLKGSLYCGHCGSRMSLIHARSHTGRRYPYFFCIGRMQGTGCPQKYRPVEAVEVHVEQRYLPVHFASAHDLGVSTWPGYVETVRERLTEALAGMAAESQREARLQRARLGRLETEREALLDAYLAEAMPIHLLKKKQDALTRQVAQAEQHLAHAEAAHGEVQTILDKALDLATTPYAAYQRASPQIRRLWNQALFERFLIVDEGIEVTGLAEPFRTLLDPSLLDHLAAPEKCEATHVSEGHGSKERLLVGETGFEPATARPPAGCATRLRHSPW